MEKGKLCAPKSLQPQQKSLPVGGGIRPRAVPANAPYNPTPGQERKFMRPRRVLKEREHFLLKKEEIWGTEGRACGPGGKVSGPTAKGPRPE